MIDLPFDDKSPNSLVEADGAQNAHKRQIAS